MTPDSGDRKESHKGRLKRLKSGNYIGHTFVHWSMTIGHRVEGWLDERSHFQIREAQIHSLARWDLACAAYCLMPEHGHFLWLGIDAASSQKSAVANFRRNWNLILRPRFELQRQPYDHVLRKSERERDAFVKIAHYILENPVRAGLVKNWKDYPFLCSIVPGYANLDPREDDFWEDFWKIYNRVVGDLE